MTSPAPVHLERPPAKPWRNVRVLGTPSSSARSVLQWF